MTNETVTFTAQLRDEMSGPLGTVTKNVNQSAAQVKTATKEQADAVEKAAQRMTQSNKTAGSGFSAMTSRLASARSAVQRDVTAMVQSARDHGQAWTQAGQTMMVAGGLMVAGVGLALKTYADFDKQMSRVQAVTHETAGNMGLLREAAISAGADTAYSAVEAGQAIEELAKAGVSTKDIMAGGLGGTLALAASDGMEVAKAAEIAATSLGIFGLSGDKAGHVADLLAAGAGKAMGSVEDLGMAVKQGGLVANQFGLSIEDTTGVLAQFAQAGLVGSDAGTSLKSMLLKLGAPSKEASRTMAELGIHAYDAQGKFVGLESLAGQLQDRMGGLTAAQRDSALATIFGSDAVRAANVLYKDGAEGVKYWRDAVDDAGYAAITAAAMQNNLAGDLEKLGGSLDTVFLKSGTGANEVLRGLAQGAEDLVDWIGKIPGPILATVAGLTGLGGAAVLGLGAIAVGVPKVIQFKDTLNTLTTNMPRAAGMLGTLAKGAAGIGVAFIAAEAAIAAFNAQAPKSATMEDSLAAITGITKNSDSLNQFFGALKFSDGDVAAGKIHNVADALREVNPEAGNWGQNLKSLGATSLGVQNSTKIILDAIKQTDAGFQSLVGSGNIPLAAKGFDDFVRSSQGQINNLQDANKYFPEYVQSLKNTAQQLGVTLTDTELFEYAQGKIPDALSKAAAASNDTSAATQALAQAQSGATQVTEEQAKALEEVGVSASGAVVNIDKFTTALVNAGLLQQSANGALRDYQQALEDTGKAAATAAGQTGVLTRNAAGAATGFDITTKAGRDAEAAFDGLAGKGLAAATAMAKNGSTLPQVQAQLKTTYNDVLKNANAMGINGQAAIDLTRKVLGIPKNAKVDSWMSSAAKAMAQETLGEVNKVDGQNATVTVTTNRITNNIVRSINEVADSVFDFGASILGNTASGGTINTNGTISRGYGTVPGYSPGVDNFRALTPFGWLGLSGGETVVRPEVTRAFGPGNLAAINRAAITGGVSGVERAAPQILSKTMAPRAVTAAPVINRSGDNHFHFNITGNDNPEVTARAVRRQVSEELDQRSRSVSRSY